MAKISNINSLNTNNSGENEQKTVKKYRKKDMYKDTPLRKLGFLDEYGEALRPVLSMSKNPLIKQLPNIAYIPATAYIALDVYDKYKTGAKKDKKTGIKLAAREGMYQGITSVIAPMFIIKKLNKISSNLISRLPKSPKFVKNIAKNVKNSGKNSKFANFLKTSTLPVKLLGAFISIFAISKLSKPIDFLTDKVFKVTIDPILGLNNKKTKNK